MSFRVFVRAWWRDARPSDGQWPNGLVPDASGEQTNIARVATVEEARARCKQYNDTHKPGRYSRKAEFTEE